MLVKGGSAISGRKLPKKRDKAFDRQPTHHSPESCEVGTTKESEELKPDENQTRNFVFVFLGRFPALKF
jgi:hypothetical protein